MEDEDNQVEDTQTTQESSSLASLYWAWAFIALATFIDFGYEEVSCLNGLPVDCNGVDFTNIGFGIIAAIILMTNWSTIAPTDDAERKSKWGAYAAVAACVGLFFTAFDGVGCRCW